MYEDRECQEAGNHVDLFLDQRIAASAGLLSLLSMAYLSPHRNWLNTAHMVVDHANREECSLKSVVEEANELYSGSFRSVCLSAVRLSTECGLASIACPPVVHFASPPQQ